MNKIHAIIKFAALAVVVAGCSLQFEAPVLPGVQLDNLPNQSAGGKMPPSAGDLMAASKKDTAENKKSWIANLTWDSGVASENKIDASINCVQLVQLSTGPVIVDFTNQQCPASSALASASSIVQSVVYQKISSGVYELYLSKSGTNVELGRMEISGSEVKLVELCTGSVYEASCFVISSSNRISSIYLYGY